MSTAPTRHVQEALEDLGLPAATTQELRALYRTADWQELLDGVHDPATAARDCADVIAAWRRGAGLPAGDDDEVARIRARSLTRYEAAAHDPDVQAFRAEVLAGRLMRLDDVREWVRRQEVPPSQRRNLEDLALPFEDYRRVRVPPGSDLEALRTVAVRLVRRYGWTEDQAVAFILADAVPAVSGLMAGIRSTEAGDTIVLEVSPDVPADVVRARYSELQAEVNGRPYRAPKRQSLDVLSEWILTGRRSFRELARCWNRDHGGDVTTGAVREAVRRNWQAFTGADCPGPSPE